MDENLLEEIDDLISNMEGDEVTRALTLLGPIMEDLGAESDEGTTSVEHSLMRAYIAGLASRPDKDGDTDLLVGITPEDAANLVAGLLGDGATLTLSVVRRG